MRKLSERRINKIDKGVNEMAEMSMAQLERQTLKELYSVAKSLKLSNFSKLSKRELILEIIKVNVENDGFAFMEGVLDIIASEGFGFLRPINYAPSSADIYISASQIRRFELRNGDKVQGKVRAPKENERYAGLLKVVSVNGENPEVAKDRVHFPALKALYPDRHMNLESSPEDVSARLIDLVAPIGFGQRGLIVAQPKAGKTMLLKKIANAISINHPKAELIMLLIDERPEEVTDIERSVNAEVVSSTFDEVPENHVRIAELVLERAKRLVEQKRDVIILMDSITRLARAYNLVVPPSGRTLSGGIDPAAFHRPKRFFGAARNIEEGGSLTIVATALIDTGSRMDDIIYEEFKGTGNMELHLSRQLSERRIFPAVDIRSSGTRREDLLLSKDKLERLWKIRKAMPAQGDNLELTNRFIKYIKQTKTNEDFFEYIAKQEQKKK
ncbi:transcriptional terminator Rho [Brochothrix thermosphacta]|nr:transcriptional terminator Rho [Brochothrix thermosphacta]SPN70769.1 transcriptional terminator Rho [Brochothrix thermosphacta]SPN75674.1 transcriptional terminator Rho [Brochothrix thermosphacta]SPP28915.1 transcriptional terminator Rho [Brochothrix thermosphacta]